MRIERLFQLVNALGAKRSTAAELASRFDVSSRTIYRDVEILVAAGIPVTTEKGKRGGIQLMEGFALGKSVLTEKERTELLSGLKGLGSSKRCDSEDMIAKLGVLLHHDAGYWINNDLYDAIQCGRKAFDDIKASIAESRILAFDYIDDSGKKRSCTVEPDMLWLKSKTWYMYAYSLEKKADQAFSLNRIKSPRILNETFSPRKSLCSPEPEEKEIFLRMKLEASQLCRASKELEEGWIIESPDGGYEISASVSEGEWLYGYILSFGEHARVIEPAHVRNVIKERLKNAVEVYSETR
ncbi:MAG: YafY family transcriptional regulator [Clostridiales bacterium]|jgi:predicted DNA-binding transcriptional regulator YafY|nr:YafY family transcriptional regulator [Clostridiales bacterium]